MVKRMREEYDCDVCGKEGDRYSIVYPDGTLILDRCEKHAVKLLAFKDEKGSWAGGKGKATFKVSTLEEIRRQRIQT